MVPAIVRVVAQADIGTLEVMAACELPHAMKPPKQVTVSVPLMGLAVGTRAMLGAGVALLLAEEFTPETRKAVGWTLVTVGVLTTFPIAWEVFGKGCVCEDAGGGR
jgi:hypothetical protein